LQVAIAKEVLSSGHYLVCSDNTGVVSVLNKDKGRSRSHETNQVLKSTYTSLVAHNLRISAVYVPSRDNVTDALSRGSIQGSDPITDPSCQLPDSFIIASARVPPT
jgi:hypothetical protein